MMLRTIFLGLAVGSLAVVGCGSDDSGGGSSGSGGTTASGGTSSGGTSSGGTSSGGTSSGGMAGSSSGGMAGSSSGGMAGSSSGGMAGSGSGGMAGGGGSAGASGAQAFCASYETHCGFGATGHYTDSNDCMTKYDGYTASRKSCVETHLGLADSKTSIHCTHAAGAAPCDQ